jgi:outer membrane protein assembly factor BamB
VCYDFSGQLLWVYDKFKVETGHGAGSSPLIYKDLVILAQDQNKADSIFIAVDKRTGELRWQQTRPKAMTWSSPTVIRSGDRDELIVAGGKTVVGYNPLDGESYWTLTGTTVEVVPTVVVGPHLIISASGRNGPTIGFRPGGTGDVSATHLAWRTVRGGPHVPSPVLVGNRLFVVNDTGIATCLNSETGELVWQNRIEDSFSASPIVWNGLIYFPSETGVTYVLRAADEFEIVSQNDLGDPILASPAVVGDQMLIRTKEDLFCIGDLTNVASGN